MLSTTNGNRLISPTYFCSDSEITLKAVRLLNKLRKEKLKHSPAPTGDAKTEDTVPKDKSIAEKPAESKEEEKGLPPPEVKHDPINLDDANTKLEIEQDLKELLSHFQQKQDG